MRYKVNDRRGFFPSWVLALTFPYFTSGFMISANATVQTGNQQQMATATTGFTLVPTTISVDKVESTTAITVCQDTIDSCSRYGRTACTNKVYEAWSKAHCAMYCGFCTPSVPFASLCDNKIPNCDEYDSGNLCTDTTYYSWAYENCRGYCKFGICEVNVCEDSNGTNCMLLDAAVNICDDVQKAKTICRKHCNLCNVTDGEWCPWGTWSSCDVTCGNGTNVRSRQCACDAPAYGGDDCNGDAQMTKACPVIPCPVHGGWSGWSSWGSCSVTCGIGLQRRNRNCSNPYPGPDGNPCLGDARDYRICFTRACADGHCSSWSRWSTCSASCLGGLSTRTRQCNNPPPSTFGHDCIGNSKEAKVCNSVTCPVVHGHWASWSSWSKCDTHCVKKRTRSCTNPAPSTFGHTCSGNSEDKENCSDLSTCSITVRLRGGNTSRSGRVEVSRDGVNWGTMCDDVFDRTTNGAKVVCRMLGYPTSRAQHYTASGGSGPIFLDGVSCTGSESSLLYCKHNRWNDENCSHSEDIGVRCD